MRDVPWIDHPLNEHGQCVFCHKPFGFANAVELHIYEKQGKILTQVPSRIVRCGKRGMT